MRAVGASYTEILAATGLYNSQPGLHAFFNNRTYLGIRKCGDLEVEGAHEPLITPETWDAAQQLKQRHPRTGARKRHPRRQRSRYLLSGLLHCGQCGAAMCGSYSPARQMKDGNRAEWRFYICGRKTREHLQACPSSRLKAEMLEDAVLHTIVDTVLTPEHLQHLLEDTNSALTAKRDDLTQRQKRLECDFAEVDRRIARLLDALEQGKSGAIRERLERRERERKRLQGEWQTVEERLKASTLEISPAALQTLIGEMHHVLKSGDVRKTRRLLRTLVVRIEATRQGGVL
jgi:molecular chaperone GrpE (heat shock protein)